MFCTKAVSEKKQTQKYRKRILRRKLSFLIEHVFFRKIRHNRHFFRQTGRKFFIAEKISFK